MVLEIPDVRGGVVHSIEVACTSIELSAEAEGCPGRAEEHHVPSLPAFFVVLGDPRGESLVNQLGIKGKGDTIADPS